MRLLCVGLILMAFTTFVRSTPLRSAARGAPRAVVLSEGDLGVDIIEDVPVRVDEQQRLLVADAAVE